MRHRVPMVVAVLMVLTWASLLVAGQAPSTATQPKAGAEDWKPPAPKAIPARTPDGQPNLQGVWSYSAAYTPLERPAALKDKAFFTREEAAAWIKNAIETDVTRDPGVHYDFSEWGLDKWQTGVTTNLRTSIITDPPDGRLPPLTEEAKKRSTTYHPFNPYWKGLPDFPHLDMYARCITGYWDGGGPMLRPGLGNGAQGETEILQSPGYVVIFTDSNNDTRIVPLDGRPRLSPTTTKWFGDSRGHWEGETLVVETTNFNDQAHFNTPASNSMANGRNLRVVERFTRISPDLLRYQLTVDDPTTWTKPWSGEVPWPRVSGPMYEAACTEENYSVLNVLKGEKATQDAARKNMK